MDFRYFTILLKERDGTAVLDASEGPPKVRLALAARRLERVPA